MQLRETWFWLALVGLWATCVAGLCLLLLGVLAGRPAYAAGGLGLALVSVWFIVDEHDRC